MKAKATTTVQTKTGVVGRLKRGVYHSTDTLDPELRITKVGDRRLSPHYRMFIIEGSAK